MDTIEQLLSEAIEITRNHISAENMTFSNWRTRTEQFFFNTYGPDSYEYITLHGLSFTQRAGKIGDPEMDAKNALAFERDMGVAIGLLKGRKNGSIMRQETNIRTEIFISHRSSDADVADMIKDFLVVSGIPNDKIFCSSLPGNDTNERISPEVKKHLHDASINILILSQAYYDSAYCLNESGVIWYLDEALAVPIGLPEIDHSKMIGFLNSDYKLRRLDNDEDIAYLYDEAKERVSGKQIKVSVITRETNKLKERYHSYLRARESETEDHIRNPEELAAQITDIRSKIEVAIVDKSWVKTQKDRLKLLEDHSLQFKCNNLILKDPTVSNPTINKGLIKVEPYDFSDDGIVVITPGRDTRKKVVVQGRGIVEVGVYSEVLFRDILEVQEYGSKNWLQPTLSCKFTNGSPFNRDVYYDISTGNQISEERITDYNPIKSPKLEVKLTGSGGVLGSMIFSLTNASSNIISGIKVTGLEAHMEDGKVIQVGLNPKVTRSVLRSGESTEIELNNGVFGNGYSRGPYNPWVKFTAVLYLGCEDENDNSFSYKVSKRVEKITDNNLGTWDVVCI